MTSEWKTTTLGNLADYINGRGFKKSEWREKGIPIIRIQNLTGSTEKINYYGGQLDEKHHIQKGDLLLSWAATLDVYEFNQDEGALNQHIFKVIPKPDVKQKFLYYLLKNKLADLYAQTHGSGMVHITAGKFKSTPAKLPSPEKQEKIVDKIEELFSEIDNAISLKNKAIKQLELWYESSLNTACSGKRQDLFTSSSISYDQLLTSRRDSFDGKGKYKDPIPVDRSKIFDIPPHWTWCTIDSLAFVTKLAGFEYTKYVKYDPNGDLPVIKAENAGKKGFKKTEYSKVKSESVSMLTRSQISGGDLLMVFVGAGTSNVARVPSDQKYFLGPNIAMMRVLSPHVIPEYLELYLRSPLGHRLAMSFAKAVAQPSLSMGTIRAIPVALPPMEEQEKIVQYLEQVETEYNAGLNEIKASIKLAENIKQSILSKAFKGELA